MTNVLCFDTETYGLVNQREKPDHVSQPHLAELGCVLYDATGAERCTVNLIVKPYGREIPKSAADVHGITTEMANGLGVPLVVALAVFSNLTRLANLHVGHNVDFDLKVLQAAFHAVDRPFPAMNPRCTKNLADPVLRLPPTAKMISAGFGHKFKPPNLGECYRHLFGEELVGAHGALTDARACGRVFFELLKRQETTLEPAT